MGIKPNDVTLSWETLNSYNRKILDSTSIRYFFVARPVELKVCGLPNACVAKLPLHPEQPEKGFREYTVTPSGEDKAVSLWISGSDTEAMQHGQTIRLMELFNIKIEEKNSSGITASFLSESYEEVRKIKVQLIQWIPKSAE